MTNLDDLRNEAYRANMALNDSGLVLLTFGNVSVVNRDSGIMMIKPSGVPYEELSPEAMAPVSLSSGEKMEGDLNPSSDTDTHLEIYRTFPGCGAVVHTHSEYATACAQARVPIRCMGTTHADSFCGDIPVTRPLTDSEIQGDYERNTGRVIAETFGEENGERVPAVLVANHGPFVWGSSGAGAVHNAVIVEYLARVQTHASSLNPDAPRPSEALIRRHYFRKHGDSAYYGQS